jgi:chromodomain-helicase-DNA-binding protein 4
MASKKHISESEKSEDDEFRTPEPEEKEKEPSQPLSVLSHRFRESPQKPEEEHKPSRASASASDAAIAVMVSAPARPWEYQPFRGDTTVDTVLEEIDGPGGRLWYKIEYEDGRKEDVSLDFCSFGLKCCQFTLIHPKPTL